MPKPIFVTQPYLPPLEEFLPYLEAIWESKTLTNGGPMHRRLEAELCDYLGVKHISLFANGTLALDFSAAGAPLTLGSRRANGTSRSGWRRHSAITRRFSGP